MHHGNGNLQLVHRQQQTETFLWPVLFQFSLKPSPNLNPTRNSAIADKPHDAFVQYAMGWLTPETCPSPVPICVSVLNLAALDQPCTHQQGKTPKLGSAGAMPPWDGLCGRTPENKPLLICVTMPNFVILHEWCKHRGKPKDWGAVGVCHVGWEAWPTPRNMPLSHMLSVLCLRV